MHALSAAKGADFSPNRQSLQSLRNSFHSEGVEFSRGVKNVLRMRPHCACATKVGVVPLITLRMRDNVPVLDLARSVMHYRVLYLQKGTTKSPTLRTMEGWKEILRGLGSERERSSELSKCARDSHITIAIIH